MTAHAVRSIKALFAPLPVRAISDHRLSALHFRVLAAIAMHDRMSDHRKAGQGCWASNKTLAEEVGCDYTRLSATITALGSFGYIDRRPHPLNKRLRVYRVIYGEDDSLRIGKLSDDDAPPIVCEDASDHGPTVCRPNSQLPQINEQLPVNIFRETDNKFCRSSERNSPEGAPSAGDGGADARAREGMGNVGGRVAQFEREWRRARATGNAIKRGDVERYRDQLGEIYLHSHAPEQVKEQALRIIQELELYLRNI
jgi:DNA-binding MarR family transcriptional regulator